jgi:hypothetical protein
VTKNNWATFWATFSQTHLVTLVAKKPPKTAAGIENVSCARATPQSMQAQVFF